MNEKKKIKKMEEREMWWMVASKIRELLSVLLMLPWVSLYRS